jgi:hypothetical protein
MHLLSMDFGLFGNNNSKPSINSGNNISGNLIPDANEDKDKHHYFIGAIIEDVNIIKKLKNLRKKLISKYNLKEFHMQNYITANFIYLGYFNIEIAKLYMKDIMSFLVKALTKNFSKLSCKMTNFKMEYDQVYYKIMLQFEAQNNILKDKIIPYLYKKGIEPVYGSKKYNAKPSIDIVHFKESDKIEEQKKKFGRKFKIIADFPTDMFVIDKLCLLQATPVKSRVGTPSTHDQLDFEKVAEYDYTFEGNTNNFKKNNNQRQNTTKPSVGINNSRTNNSNNVGINNSRTNNSNNVRRQNATKPSVGVNNSRTNNSNNVHRTIGVINGESNNNNFINVQPN